ncbi:MAG: SMC-Scp complex subunit ScpB [Mariprofundaceae bacterium]|nr:SMC-Scp complex subunit ScpB [Mariprofundaceae bacterium]
MSSDFSATLSAKLEALIIASDEPLSLARMRDLTDSASAELREALSELQAHYRDRGIYLHEVAGGWQFRSAPRFSDTVQQLWQTRPPRLSRSMLETLSIIAYRQPTTRGEIEMLRGVKVSSSIIGGLQERGWIKVLGRKEVPGRPHLYGTSKTFLIDFGLNSLADLPEIAQLMDQDELEAAARSQAENQLEDRTEEQTEEQTEGGAEDSADEYIPTNADNGHKYEEDKRQSGPERGAETGENQAFESTQGECRESEPAAAERR